MLSLPFLPLPHNTRGAFTQSRTQRSVLVSMREDPERLRAELESAVRTENFAQASALKAEISMLRLETEVAVLDANAAWYSALRDHDATAMEEVWPETPLSTMCCRVYDGFPLLRGRSAVLDTWRKVRSDQQMATFDTRCVVLRGGYSAVVTCVERRLGGGSGDSALSVMNLFELALDDASWHLALHQATPMQGPASSMPEQVVEYDADDFPGATG